MLKPHKHHDMIIEYAKGHKIQFRQPGISKDWMDVTYPSFAENMEYRIKPEPKPDLVIYYAMTTEPRYREYGEIPFKNHNLVLTFNGETGELKSAEVRK